MALISPVAFYKTSNSVKVCDESSRKVELGFYQKLREVQNRAKLYKDRPLVSSEKKSFFASHKVFETFGTLNQAVDFCLHYREKISKDVRLFSEEKSDDGKRKFLVSDLNQFWSRYKTLHDDRRNFYEVIEDGRPCRLYFDLEFYKDPNPDLIGIEVLEIFIKTICFYLQELFSISCYRGNIIDLDSTTDKKFSRHLIFHLPSAIFLSNISCGNFIKYVYEMTRRKFIEGGNEMLSELKLMNITEKEILPPLALETDKLFVNNKDGNKTYFCDLGVYSKNRNFRLYGSTKFGKKSNLVIAKENGFHGVSKKTAKVNKAMIDPEYVFFLETLVCPPETADHSTQVLTFGETEALPGHKSDYNRTGIAIKTEEGYKESPFPKLDAFILNNVRQGGIQGIIRKWVHFVNSNLMIYEIGRNRWCHKAKRAHRSNHVYYVVDMKYGVFYQKCHDPECQDFKSAEMTLPAEVNPACNDSEYFIDEFEDSSQLLYEAAEVVECEQSFNAFNDETGFFCDDFQISESETEKLTDLSNWGSCRKIENKDFQTDNRVLTNNREMLSKDGNESLRVSMCVEDCGKVDDHFRRCVEGSGAKTPLSFEILNMEDDFDRNEGSFSAFSESFRREEYGVTVYSSAHGEEIEIGDFKQPSNYVESNRKADGNQINTCFFDLTGQGQRKERNSDIQIKQRGFAVESTPVTCKKNCLDDSILRCDFPDICLDDGLDDELMNFS